MSLDNAHLIHEVPGRYRVRIPGRRRDAAYFRKLQEVLSEHEQVLNVTANSLTAGIFIEHEALDVASLRQYAVSHSLFDLQQQLPPLAPALETAGNQLRTLNRQFSSLSNQYLDTRGLAFILLVIFGVRQLIRGNLIGPAASLFWYAFQILKSSEPQP